MKKIFKYTFIILFILFHMNGLYAQASISLNANGTFLIFDGLVIEIQTEHKINSCYFWEDYIVLNGDGIIGFYLYNIGTGAVSDLIYGSIVILDKSATLKVIFNSLSPVDLNDDSWEYNLTPDTLEIINRTKLENKLIINFTIEDNTLQITEKEIINERTFRYKGKKFYLDINYGRDIDLTGKYMDYIVSGGINNIFIIILHEIDHYK